MSQIKSKTEQYYLLMSFVDLHVEVKILPVRRHNFMLSKQNLIGCYLRSQPNCHLVHRLPPTRQIRKDHHDLEREVQPYKREPLDQIAYQTGLNNIHSDSVANIIAKFLRHISVLLKNAAELSCVFNSVVGIFQLK